MSIDNGLNVCEDFFDLSIQLKCGDNLFVYDILSELAGFLYHFQYKYKKSSFKKVSISFQADTLKNYNIKKCDSVEVLLFEIFNVLSLFNKPFKMQRHTGEQKFSNVSFYFGFYGSEREIISDFNKSIKNKERFSFYVEKLKEIIDAQLIEKNREKQKIVTREQRKQMKDEKEKLRLAALTERLVARDQRRKTKAEKEQLRLAASRDRIRIRKEKREKEQQERLKLKDERERKRLASRVYRLKVNTVHEPLTESNTIAKKLIPENKEKDITELMKERERKRLASRVYRLKVNTVHEPLTENNTIEQELIPENKEKDITELMKMNIVYTGNENIINDLQGFFK